VRAFIWYEKTLIEENKLCLARIQCSISSSLLHGLVHRHLYCWTLAIILMMTCLQLKKKRLLLALSAVFYFMFMCIFVYEYIVIL